MRNVILVFVVACGVGCGKSEPDVAISDPGDSLDALFDADASMRKTAVVALGETYAPAAVPLLVEAVEDDDPSVGAEAAKALAAIGRKGLEVYCHFVFEEAGTREPAWLDVENLLIKHGAAFDGPGLRARIRKDGDSEARKAAAAAAALAGVFGGASDRDGEAMMDFLAQQLGDDDEDVRKLCAASVAILGWSTVAATHPPTLDEMKPAREGLKSEFFHLRAAMGLIGLLAHGNKTLEDEAHAVMHGEESSTGTLVGMMVLTHVYYRGDEKPLEGVRKGLEKAGTNTNRFAEALLFSSDSIKKLGEKARPLAKSIASMIPKASGWNRLYMVQALIDISPDFNKIAVAAAKQVFEDPKTSDSARMAALRKLLAIRPPATSAAEVFLKVLSWNESSDDEAHRRLRAKRWAAAGLGRCGAAAKPALPKLEELAKHADARLRYCATVALRQIG